MANVLITGAGGFLGTQLVREFVDAGHAVRAGDLEGASLERHAEMGAQPVVFDVARRDTMEAATEGCDVVVHAAGLFDLNAPSEVLFAVNDDGARVACEVAAEQDVERFLLVSSTGIYGKGGLDANEDKDKGPISEYDKSKWAGEQSVVALAGERSLPLTVIRPTLIYGPGSRYGLACWLALFALRAHHNLKVAPIARGGPMGHHVHVKDVARATRFLLERDDTVGGTYNIADDTPITAGELVRIIAGSAGVRVLNQGLPWWCGRIINLIRPLAAWYLKRENPRLAHLWSRYLADNGLVQGLSPRIDLDWVGYLLDDHTYDNGRLKQLGFEFQHPDVRQGLAETLAWYREKRWLPEA